MEGCYEHFDESLHMNIGFHCVFSCSLWPHGLQHAMSFPLSQEFAQIHIHWVSDGLSNHLIHCPLLLLLSIFPRSGSFPMSRLFISDGQCIRVSTSASVLPVNVQGWFSLGWPGFRLFTYLFLMERCLLCNAVLLFFHTSAWISHRHAYVPFLLNLFSTSHPKSTF